MFSKENVKSVLDKLDVVSWWQNGREGTRTQIVGSSLNLLRHNLYPLTITVLKKRVINVFKYHMYSKFNRRVNEIANILIFTTVVL